MSRGCLVVLSLALAPIAGPAADGPDAGALIQSQLAVTRQAADTLKPVTDRTSAERVKPKLAELDARYEQLQKQLQSRPEEEQDQADGDTRAERVKADDALALAHDRVFAGHKDAYKVLATTAVFKRVELRHVNDAKLRMQKIEQACKAYHVANQQWPLGLKVLVEKEGELPPRLEGGRNAIVDPWGAPFQYQVVNVSGFDRVVLSTVNPYGDGKQVIRWPDR